jgi:hypothetical protein
VDEAHPDACADPRGTPRRSHFHNRIIVLGAALCAGRSPGPRPLVPPVLSIDPGISRGVSGPVSPCAGSTSRAAGQESLEPADVIACTCDTSCPPGGFLVEAPRLPARGSLKVTLRSNTALPEALVTGTAERICAAQSDGPCLRPVGVRTAASGDGGAWSSPVSRCARSIAVWARSASIRCAVVSGAGPSGVSLVIW